MKAFKITPWKPNYISKILSHEVHVTFAFNLLTSKSIDVFFISYCKSSAKFYEGAQNLCPENQLMDGRMESRILYSSIFMKGGGQKLPCKFGITEYKNPLSKYILCYIIKSFVQYTSDKCGHNTNFRHLNIGTKKFIMDATTGLDTIQH